jgi:hypothetical protein
MSKQTETTPSLGTCDPQLQEERLREVINYLRRFDLYPEADVLLSLYKHRFNKESAP